MTIRCRKSARRATAAQWNLDAMLDAGDGPIPAFFSVVPTWCAFQTVSSEKGEKLIGLLAGALGAPDDPPQIVKGGSCGGEEEESEFPFAGAMISVTWTFPRERRDGFLETIERTLGACGEDAA